VGDGAGVAWREGGGKCGDWEEGVGEVVKGGYAREERGGRSKESRKRDHLWWCSFRDVGDVIEMLRIGDSKLIQLGDLGRKANENKKTKAGMKN